MKFATKLMALLGATAMVATALVSGPTAAFAKTKMTRVHGYTRVTRTGRKVTVKSYTRHYRGGKLTKVHGYTRTLKSGRKVHVHAYTRASGKKKAM
ncbi:MAG: hypothetical protein ACLQVD_14995 [Capsulimonadaceae bacterium]